MYAAEIAERPKRGRKRGRPSIAILGAAVVAARIREIFRANLARILAENKVNQRKLADDIGVSAQVISWWKSGTSYPKTDAQIDRLIKALNIMPEDLFLDPSRVRMTPTGEVDSALVEAIRQALKSSGYEVTIKRKQ